MPSLASTSLPTPAAFWRWGRVCLAGGLALGLLAVVYLAWNAPALLPFLPVVLFGGVATWYLFRHPLLNLTAVLGGFAAIAGFDKGLQVSEALYAAYLLLFLAHWYVTRLYLERVRILRHGVDRTIIFFLCYVTGSFFLTGIFGSPWGTALREWMVLISFALYFPIKEACVRYRRTPAVLVGIVLFLGLFVAVRNLLNFEQILASATYAWQIARGRVTTNEIFLVLPALTTFTWVLYTRHRSLSLVLLGAFLLFFGSLILTQSRAYWIDFAWGMLILFLLIGRRYKVRLLWISGLGMLGIAALGLLLFGDTILLMVYGLVERLLTLTSATSSDVSLINRFYESAGAWKQIQLNPIVGYGLGAQYRVYDIISGTTKTKTFIHNSFLLLWFKFGLIGLSSVLYIWFGSVRLGWRALRSGHPDFFTKLGLLVAVVGLIALIPSTFTSLQFYMSDTTFMFALLSGWAAGLAQRSCQSTATIPE